MQRLTFDDLLAVTATPLPTFKALRLRGQLALAFGARSGYASMSYLGLDALAIMLADTLAKSYSRPQAAHLVRTYWDIWCAVLARADADASRPAHFSIVDFVTRAGKAAHMVCGAEGAVDDDEIALTLAPSFGWRCCACARTRARGLIFTRWRACDLPAAFARAYQDAQ